MKNQTDRSAQPMVTLAQLIAAHRKVKSGADFPNYVQTIKQLGILKYISHVADGHVAFFAENGAQLTSAAKYEALQVASACNAEAFRAALKAHQQGRSDYPTFCRTSAEQGIEKWVVDTQEMTCTYYNRAGDAVLVETILQQTSDV